MELADRSDTVGDEEEGMNNALRNSRDPRCLRSGPPHQRTQDPVPLISGPTLALGTPGPCSLPSWDLACPPAGQQQHRTPSPTDSYPVTQPCPPAGWNQDWDFPGQAANSAGSQPHPAGAGSLPTR